MPNLLNRSKHEELESNSALQIRNQKEMRVEKVENQAFCRRVRKLRNFRTVRTFLPAFVIFGPFDFLLTHFLFFLPFYPSCIMGIEGNFVFFFLIRSTI